MTPQTVRAFVLGAATMALVALVLGGGVYVSLRIASRATSERRVTTPSPIVAPIVASPVARTPSSDVAGCPSGLAVTTEGGLSAALAAAAPGSVIVMEAGTYTGRFVATTSGTADQPITLCGSPDAMIDGGDTTSGYALYLNGASYWNVTGFSIQGAQKGLVTDHAQHNLISGLYVHDIGDEGIHLREFSSDNVIDGVKVRNTGLNNKKFGEGIYVGTANSNWCKYTACKPDNSDRNVIRNSDIAQTTAENIDIKEGTSNGVIVGNHLAGAGMVASAATAWVNLKGNSWTVTGNIGQGSIKDGFQVHRVYAGWGAGNVFRSNQAVVNGPGYGFYVQSSSLQTLVGCSNSAVGAARGLSNEACTNA